jgi:hypothetical protein
MNRRVLVGVFAREADILSATRAARQHQLALLDVYTPYAVHGLDEAMGLSPSRLPWVCFALGLLGAGAKVWFEYWTTAVSWPINVGGKPWNSLPAFIPVTFEVMVLFAGLSTVIAFFIVAGLRPGKRPRHQDPLVTDNRFVLVIEQTDAAFDVPAVVSLLERHGAVRTEERVEEVVS